MPTAHDWDSLQLDVCNLSVLDDDMLPWMSRGSQSALCMAYAASYLYPKPWHGVSADTRRNNAVEDIDDTDLAVLDIENKVKPHEEHSLGIICNNYGSADPIIPTSK